MISAQRHQHRAAPGRPEVPGDGPRRFGDGADQFPARGRDGVVAGAIGVVGAAERLLAPATRRELVRAASVTARAISRDLGAARGGAVLTALS